MTIDDIVLFLKERGIFLNQDQKVRLDAYVELLVRWNQKIHLVSKGDVTHIVERHILPAFVFVDYVLHYGGEDRLNILDLGTGAGLPGVVMSIALPANRFWLLDSSRKKTLFLQKVKKELELEFKVVNERFELWQGKHTLKIDLITARAVASIKNLLELTGSFLQEKKAVLVTMKPCNLDEDIPDVFKESVKMNVQKNDFYDFSEYLKEKCLVSMEFLHGRKKII